MSGSHPILEHLDPVTVIFQRQQSAFLLGYDDILLLLHHLKDITDKWQEIGIALGFSQEVLDDIKTSTSTGGSVACLIEMLTRWLKCAPPKYCLPTLEALLEALRHDTVGEHRIAYNLEQEFMSSSRCIANRKRREVVLSKDHLQLLLHYVEHAAEKWRAIGTVLKFSKELLDAIETSPKGPVACLTEMLTYWLKRAPPKYSFPTLEALLEALRDDTIEEYRIAYGIEQEFTGEYSVVLEPPQVSEQSTSVPQPNDAYSHTAPQPQATLPALTQPPPSSQQNSGATSSGIKTSEASKYDHVDDSDLTMEDHFDVVDAALDIAHQWEEFGGALHIHPAILQKIASYHRSNPDSCLRSVVLYFLQKNYDTQKYGRPSWRLIVQAVAHRAGGQNEALAQKISDNHRLSVVQPVVQKLQTETQKFEKQLNNLIPLPCETVQSRKVGVKFPSTQSYETVPKKQKLKVSELYSLPTTENVSATLHK